MVKQALKVKTSPKYGLIINQMQNNDYEVMLEQGGIFKSAFTNDLCQSSLNQSFSEFYLSSRGYAE